MLSLSFSVSPREIAAISPPMHVVEAGKLLVSASKYAKDQEELAQLRLQLARKDEQPQGKVLQKKMKRVVVPPLRMTQNLFKNTRTVPPSKRTPNATSGPITMAAPSPSLLASLRAICARPADGTYQEEVMKKFVKEAIDRNWPRFDPYMKDEYGRYVKPEFEDPESLFTDYQKKQESIYRERGQPSYYARNQTVHDDGVDITDVSKQGATDNQTWVDYSKKQGPSNFCISVETLLEVNVCNHVNDLEITLVATYDCNGLKKIRYGRDKENHWPSFQHAFKSPEFILQARERLAVLEAAARGPMT